MGGFRTPAHTKSLDLRRPASENLHHFGHLDVTSAYSDQVESPDPKNTRQFNMLEHVLVRKVDPLFGDML